MQLKGAPRINDWLAPYATAQTPLRAAFRRDPDVETYVKTRDGTLARVGDQALRGRFTFGWDGLDYDTALRILYEVRSGEVELTPRTDIGGGALIDIDGDGIPDLILEEVRLPCRVIEDIPTSTPINRRARQAAIAGLELTFETLGTYSEIPGLTTPPQFTYETYATTGPWTVGFRSDREQYVDWGILGETSQGVNPTKTYQADTGPFTVTVVSLSSKIPVFEFIGGTPSGSDHVRVKLTNSDLSDLKIESGGGISFRLDAGVTEGTLTTMPGGDPSVFQGAGGQLTYQTSLVPRTIDEIDLNEDAGIEGDVNLLPQNMIVVDLEDFDGGVDNVLKIGGPVGPRTTFVDLRRSAVTLGPDFQFTSVNNNGPAPRVEELVLRNSQSSIPLMYGMRKLEIIESNLAILDFSGPPPVPSTLRDWRAFGVGLRQAPSDSAFLSQMDLVAWIANKNRGVTEGYSVRSDTGPQYQVVWDALYSNRTSLKSTAQFNLVQDPFNEAYICTGTADDVWKMAGYPPYHTDGVIDHVQSLSLSNLLQSSVVRDSSTTLRFSVGSISTKSSFDTAQPKRNRLAYDTGAGDEVVARCFVNGSQAWVPLFQDGEQIRVQGTSSDVMLTINGDASYSGGDVTINTTSAIPADASSAIYAFHFDSLPAPSFID